jgi:hypothetical protein
MYYYTITFLCGINCDLNKHDFTMLSEGEKKTRCQCFISARMEMSVESKQRKCLRG